MKHQSRLLAVGVRSRTTNNRKALPLVVLLLASIQALMAPPAIAQVSPAGPQAPTTRISLVTRLSGIITLASNGQAVIGARVTLFRPDLTFFRETRSATNGSYEFTSMPTGNYQLGIESVGLQYKEVSIIVTSSASQMSFALAPETEVGRWDIIGDTLPEQFDATDIGVLRPDGTVMFCHDTSDPIVFNPVTGTKVFPPSSGSSQGCMNSTVLSDGSVLIVGGQNGSDPGSFMNAIPWVKRFWPNNTWVQLADLNNAAGRWYPGLVRLNDGRLIAIGGGTAPNAERTVMCEMFNPQTLRWSWTGSTGTPMEFPPVALLYNGKVLHSWGGQPQLFDPATGVWTNTGQLVFPNRGYPNHSDHSLIVLSDGRALAVGARRLTAPGAAMTEFYDPATEQWSTGASPALVRFQSEVVYLPDGHVLAATGDKGNEPSGEPDVLGIVKRSDLFAPVANTWRRVADMLEFREYHAVTLLIPDGRVITTGGTHIKFQYGPTSSNIEAYSPPYLSRGVRASISNLSDAAPQRGQVVDFDVFPATKLTKVVLMGTQSTTHWVDCGIPRRLELAPFQNGSSVQATLPSDPNLLPVGWYLLFAMVDDIPSKALILRVDP